jgi:anti-sigma B factor antagonist
MREQDPRLRLSVNGNVTIIELLDRKILDGVNILQIGEQLAALVTQAGEPKFVLDFSNVGHLSSSALGILITLAKRVREKAGQLRLCGIQPALLEVFMITRLNEIFQIYPSRQEAVDSIV